MAAAPLGSGVDAEKMIERIVTMAGKPETPTITHVNAVPSNVTGSEGSIDEWSDGKLGTKVYVKHNGAWVLISA